MSLYKTLLPDANKFVTPLPNVTNGIEREENTFTVQVKDPDAPVEFFIAGRKIQPGDDERVEVKNCDNGKHQLILHRSDYMVCFH